MSAEIGLFLKGSGLVLAALYNVILAFEAWPTYWRVCLSAITAWILGALAYQQITTLLASVS